MNPTPQTLDEYGMPISQLECLDDYDGKCRGAVEWRMSLTGTGTSIARCDYHWERRLGKWEQDQERYPDSPCPPSWYDYLNAGEHWDEDY